jgi:pimeloyl-ACP methyl ester carboxylesterase
MMAGTGGMMAGTGGTGGMGTGDCCPDGNCICHGDAPSALTSQNGPFDYESYRGTLGTIFYPTDAEPPFSAIAICPGFLNSGPEMEPWGPFYASHGFVLIATDTLGSDFPDIRAGKLLAAVDELKAENEDSSSPLFGKLAGRFGTSGYSMGGGGTTIASTTDATLKTSVGLAAWAPVGNGVTVPTLFLCGQSDGTAPCSQSEGAYASVPNTTPKMLVAIPGASHFAWFSPDAAGMGRSGAYALAFQKVFLNGDERWREVLVQPPSSGEFETNIEP